jgi:hypothetical protein
MRFGFGVGLVAAGVTLVEAYLEYLKYRRPPGH